MKPMRYFLDTHDRARNTFPAQLTPTDFEVFFAQYETACQAEGVIPLRTHVGYAHERVGLPYDDITEVTTATPGDTFFRRRA